MLAKRSELSTCLLLVPREGDHVFREAGTVGMDLSQPRARSEEPWEVGFTAEGRFLFLLPPGS